MKLSSLLICGVIGYGAYKLGEEKGFREATNVMSHYIDFLYHGQASKTKYHSFFHQYEIQGKDHISDEEVLGQA